MIPRFQSVKIEHSIYSGQHGDVIRRLAKKIHDWQQEVADAVVVNPA